MDITYNTLIPSKHVLLAVNNNITLWYKKNNFVD